MGNVRVSYGRNSAGVLEIADNNDYYPFGMNHLKTGTAFFRQGSYKNNKYNSKELQETGMYSYGWRDYMPDIARWNGIDQLAENYLSTSTYAYVANNPVSYADVDGRWFNEDGTIDLSGHTPGFTTGHQYQTSFLGQYPGQGGGGGSGSAQALVDKAFGFGGDWYNTGAGFAGSMNIGLGYDGSYTSLNTDYAEGGIGERIYDIPELILSKNKSEWAAQMQNHFNFFVSNLTAIANNRYFSAGHLIASESVSKFGAYSLSKALKPDYSVNYTVLDDAAKPYRITTMAGIKMKPAAAATLSKVAKYGGYGLAAVSVVATELQYADGQIGDTERVMNHMMTGVGLIPTPWTIGAGLVYGVVTGGYQAVTGRSIFNDMGLGPQKK